MSRGLGSLQRQILALMTERARYAWPTKIGDVLVTLFPDDITKRKLRWNRGRIEGGEFDERDCTRQNPQQRYCDFSETRKAQMRAAFRGLERRGLVPLADVCCNEKLWLPNPLPDEYSAAKARFDEGLERFFKTVSSQLGR